MTGDRSEATETPMRRGKTPLRQPVIDVYELDDPRLGIDDPAVAQMVLCVFSRILGTSTGKRPYVALANRVDVIAHHMPTVGTLWTPGKAPSLLPSHDRTPRWSHWRCPGRSTDALPGHR